MVDSYTNYPICRSLLPTISGQLSRALHFTTKVSVIYHNVKLHPFKRIYPRSSCPTPIVPTVTLILILPNQLIVTLTLSQLNKSKQYQSSLISNFLHIIISYLASLPLIYLDAIISAVVPWTRFFYCQDLT